MSNQGWPEGGQFGAKRIADAAIYDNLSYFEEPKEYFTLALDEIGRELQTPSSILDIGCANGAFLHHAGRRFPGAKLKGLEPVSSLADIARTQLSGASVWVGGLYDDHFDTEIGASDVVALLGVIGIFFDPEAVVKRLLALTADGGMLVIFSSFNDDPIDVVMNYRRGPNAEWESGHNLYCTATMESICAGFGVTARWVDFSISKPIPKTDDPMRSWTESFRGNPHHILYGTNTFATMKLLVIRKP